MTKKPKFEIKASVVDIKECSIGEDDVLMVDSNVWYWTTCSNASEKINAAPYQIKQYPQFLKKAKKSGVRLWHSGLSLSEIGHLIENFYLDIYRKTKNLDISKKAFRHNLSDERRNVVEEIYLAWEQVENFSENLPCSIDRSNTQWAVEKMAKARLDGYDLFILHSMIDNNVLNILTDDGVFATVEGIKVFTANKNVLMKASEAGKLVRF